MIKSFIVADLWASDLEFELNTFGYFTKLELDQTWNSTLFMSIPFMQMTWHKQMHLDLYNGSICTSDLPK